MKQLSLSARPKTLDDLVGQQKLVKRIRVGIKKNGVPKGWLFWGEKGSGKTSIARILALSLQCTHQEKFGQPCAACRKARTKLPIYSINCGKLRGVDDLEKFVDMADYESFGGKLKVFILDEAHMLSSHAQNLLLDPIESEETNAVWIICSTRPDKIIDTVRSRLKVRALQSLNRDETLELVTRLLAKRHSELLAEDLADALVDNSVKSCRLIAQAVESYIEGCTAEEAADVDSSTEISSKALCRAVVKGDWEATSSLLKKSNASDVRPLRTAVIGYLRVVLLDSSEVNDKTKTIAECIKRLSYIGSAEDVNQMGALVAELHGICAVFGENSL